jgi:hypothetical protein
MEGILHLLPPYLDSLTDLLALTTLSKYIRSTTLSSISPSTTLALTLKSIPQHSFLFPHPWPLLLVLAPSLCEHSTSLHLIKKAFQSGPIALLDLLLTLPQPGFSLSSLRELWEYTHEVIHPLSDLLDKCVGKQWYDVPDFWDGGREDAATIWAVPEENVYHLGVYGGLFGRVYEDWLIPDGDEAAGCSELDVQAMGKLDMRMEFVKYCLRDWHTGILPIVGAITSDYPYPSSNPLPSSATLVLHSISSSTANVHPLRDINFDPNGPYPPRHLQSFQEEHQTVLLHLLEASPLFRSVLLALRAYSGGDFYSEPPILDENGFPTVHTRKGWKQEIWECSVIMMGRDGLALIVEVWKRMDGNDKQRKVNEARRKNGLVVDTVDATKGELSEKLRRWRGFLKKKEMPRKWEIVGGMRGLIEVYDVPFLLGDLRIGTCTAR